MPSTSTIGRRCTASEIAVIRSRLDGSMDSDRGVVIPGDGPVSSSAGEAPVRNCAGAQAASSDTRSSTPQAKP
jgi:hypothetical protein